eukprot:200745-Pelagomonas_calceolata.AAC.2
MRRHTELAIPECMMNVLDFHLSMLMSLHDNARGLRRQVLPRHAIPPLLRRQYTALGYLHEHGVTRALSRMGSVVVRGQLSTLFCGGLLAIGNKCKAEGVMSKAPLFLSVCGAVEQDCILATSCTQQ